MQLKAENLPRSLQVDERLHRANYQRQAGANSINPQEIIFRHGELQRNGHYAEENMHHHDGHGH